MTVRLFYVRIKTMNIEKRREQYRASYYKNHEVNLQKAKERAALKRASHVETPEEAEARRIYNRAHYAKNTGPVRMMDRKVKKEAEELEIISLVPLTEPSRTLFKMALIALLAKKEEDQLTYRKEWKRQKRTLLPKKEKPVKIPFVKAVKPKPTEEELALREAKRLSKRRESEKKKTVAARENPELAAVIREKRIIARDKWLEKLKVQNPEKYFRIIESNREKARLYSQKRWREDAGYRERQAEWFKKRRVEVPEFRLGQYIRNRINQVLKAGIQRTSRAFELVGCTPAELKVHLESQFVDGMNWSNHGTSETCWQIDHVRPLASFSLSDPEQAKEAFSWKNLKPEWARVNASKNSRWNGRRWKHSDHALLAKADD